MGKNALKRPCEGDLERKFMLKNVEHRKSPQTRSTKGFKPILAPKIYAQKCRAKMASE